ncbi:MAG: DNA repair protein RecO [Chitinispirillales bacterium]|jgi:DNA repair protein RecO (recombination protein O)|nr:DNA repair protein RecO [Chitinispirillales bacterium]
MSAQKVTAVVLTITPYRETSCILRLFTHSHGLVHGIVKGARKDGKSVPLDRGFLLEMLLYYKPNRELHMLGALHVTEFFPGLRTDILRPALRDIALELYLKSITQSEPHPELFDLLTSFLKNLESVKQGFVFPLLWHFINKYCSLAGFGIAVEKCPECGADILKKGGILDIAAGVLICKKCAPVRTHTQACLDAYVISFLDKIETDESVRLKNYECLRITELLLLYCRHHFDIRKDFNSLGFVKTMLGQ